jgi:hypothetical protein
MQELATTPTYLDIALSCIGEIQQYAKFQTDNFDLVSQDIFSRFCHVGLSKLSNQCIISYDS